MTIYWQQTGQLVQYRDGMLHVGVLNPEMNTKWRMSRAEMAMFGLRCIWAALTSAEREGTP